MYNEFDSPENINYTINDNSFNKQSQIQYPQRKLLLLQQKRNESPIAPVTYDDILRKINANISRGLKNNNPNYSTSSSSYQTELYKNNNNKTTTTQSFVDKNSYIYNKFNSSWSSSEEEPTNTPVILKPRNIEEYRRMVLEQAINNHNRKVHLMNTKSKKLINVFNNNTTFIPTVSAPIKIMKMFK